MEFSSRFKQILIILLTQQAAMPIKTLANRAGISRRTVQRELECIESALKGYDIRFMSKTGVGIWLDGDMQEKKRMLEQICAGDTYDATNREDRRKRLILEILKEKGLRKLFYYSSQFGVSEATVSSDLEAAEGWLNQYGLVVNRRPGSGIFIEGSEENYRRAIKAFIDENMDTQIIKEAYESGKNLDNSYESLKRSSIGQLLDDAVISRTKDCLMEIDDARILSLTETSYTGLIIHIAIAVNRILKNEVIEMEQNWLTDNQEDEEYQLAAGIAAALEKEFEIQIPEVEVSYICLHLKGAKHEKIQFANQVLTEMKTGQFQKIINEMVDAFDAERSYLLKQDDTFIQGLLAHLQPTFIRLMHGMQIHNPVLEDIKSHYADIYLKCEKVAFVLEQHLKKAVPPEEIGYLAVHFGAALVRLEERREKIRKVYVGVVCSSGIGISRLMSSKLEKTFRDKVEVTTYGKNDITAFVEGRTDFFVSSIPLEQMEKTVLYVNPLLSEKDMQNIRELVCQYQRLPREQKEEDAFSAQLEQINRTAAQINTVIKHMDFFKVNARITFEELLIAVGERISPYSDRREMIREDLKRREQIATQVFAELGFALLHTCTKGVTRPSFSVCMTKNLDSFSDPYFKGIRFVLIMLIPVDENQRINRNIMGYISSMMIEKCEFPEIVARGNPEEIRNTVSDYLKKYFQGYLTELS